MDVQALTGPLGRWCRQFLYVHPLDMPGVLMPTGHSPVVDSSSRPTESWWGAGRGLAVCLQHPLLCDAGQRMPAGWDKSILCFSMLISVPLQVFGLGNKTYEHFNAMGKYVDKRLEELGAQRIFELGLGDDDGK